MSTDKPDELPPLPPGGLIETDPVSKAMFCFNSLPPNPADVPPPPERLAEERKSVLEEVLLMIERGDPRSAVFEILRRSKGKGWRR